MPKQTLAQFGQTIKAKHPEYADLPDDQVGQKVLAKFPQYGDMVDTGSPADQAAAAAANPFANAPAHPSTNAIPTGNLGAVDTLFANNPGEGQPGQGGYAERLRPVGNAGRRMVRNLTSMVAHPVDTVSHMAPPTPGSTDFQKLVDQVPQGETALEGLKRTTPYYQTATHPEQGGVTQATSDAGGDALTMAVLDGATRGVVPEVAPVAADAVSAAGSGLKTGGALLSRKMLGLEAPVDAMGADAGSAVSSNRIVAASPKSLSRKVGAVIPQAMDARDAILSASDASPADISPAVQQPFTDLAAPKLDPRTGAVRPGSIRQMATTRDAIANVQDPNTGAITGEAKDPNLAPSDIAKLQKNVYDLTDYHTPDSDLANQYTKKVGASLKDKLNEVAPEATEMTDKVHDLLGAQEQLKAKLAPATPTDFSPGKLLGKMYDSGRTLAGTAGGSLLDAAGSGLKSMAGAMRRFSGSPVAPVASSPSESAAPQLALPSSAGGTEENFPAISSEPTDPSQEARVAPQDMEGREVESGQTTPPPATPRGLLPQMAGEGSTSPVAPTPAPQPGLHEPAARMRVEPPSTRPRSQQVLEDQPGYVAPTSGRKLLVGPDGSVRPEPIPLESSTGRGAPSTRPSLLSKFKQEAEAGAVQQPPTPPPAAQAPPVEVAPLPAHQSAPTRLPAPDDIAAWQQLEDAGLARYNVHTKQYEYVGPIRKTSLQSKMENR